MKLAIVGRPNVGKSTLFNRLTGQRLALVDNRPGVTRDYRESAARLGNLELTLIDTAGLEYQGRDELHKSVRQITRRAVDEAEMCLFLFDARVGILAADNEVAEYLRRQNKPVVLVANKCEGSAYQTFVDEAYSLGFGEPVQISAEHGEGLGDLATAIVKTARMYFLHESGVLSEKKAVNEEYEPVRIAVVGRPNSGKSSLINRIIDADRLLTGPTPGVTRDAISVYANWHGISVRFHDTAGMRKRAKVTDKIEKLSVADGLRAVRFAEIVVVVLDSVFPFESQDVRIADLAEREGRSVVFAANKWDLVKDRKLGLSRLNELLEERLPNLRGAKLVPVSAKTGFGLKHLNSAVNKSWQTWNIRVSTGNLNRWLEEMKVAHPPPAPRGKRIRLRYMTQIKARPPSFVIMCSKPRGLPTDYMRFLKNGLRDSFGLNGVPIRIFLRSQSEDNPYN